MRVEQTSPKNMILNFGMSDFLMTVKPMYCMVSTSKSMMASAWQGLGHPNRHRLI